MMHSIFNDDKFVYVSFIDLFLLKIKNINFNLLFKSEF